MFPFKLKWSSVRHVSAARCLRLEPVIQAERLNDDSLSIFKPPTDWQFHLHSLPQSLMHFSFLLLFWEEHCAFCPIGTELKADQIWDSDKLRSPMTVMWFTSSNCSARRFTKLSEICLISHPKRFRFCEMLCVVTSLTHWHQRRSTNRMLFTKGGIVWVLLASIELPNSTIFTPSSRCNSGWLHLAPWFWFSCTTHSPLFDKHTNKQLSNTVA